MYSCTQADIERERKRELQGGLLSLHEMMSDFELIGSRLRVVTSALPHPQIHPFPGGVGSKVTHSAGF